MRKTDGPDYRYLVLDALRWLVAAVVSLCVVASLVMVCKLFSPSLSASSQKPSDTGSPEGGAAAAEIEYKHVDAPAAANENGVVTAAEWAEIYPEIVASYEANSENNYTVDYLEQDPYLANIYEGYGFAIDYNSAQGHSYCLEDVANTARPHALANCLTCKTADYTALVNKLGVEAYSMDFEEVAAGMGENVGCYNCHENEAGDAGKLVVTHDYIINGLGDAMNSIDADTLSCGQCHIEYYFNPENKATSIPYTDVATMSPEAILEYYNSIGFSDWTQESTGAALLKAQHPEMETFLGAGSIHAGMGLNCASCHMEVVTSDEGVTYTSHTLVSPLESENIQKNVCATCHADTDIVEKVHTLQDEIVARETEVGNKLGELNDKLADAVASGAYSEDELAKLRDLYRSAQWFFDFDYVENSEGAHNSALARSCLDKAEGYIDEAAALFK